MKFVISTAQATDEASPRLFDMRLRYLEVVRFPDIVIFTGVD